MSGVSGGVTQGIERRTHQATTTRREDAIGGRHSQSSPKVNAAGAWQGGVEGFLLQKSQKRGARLAQGLNFEFEPSHRMKPRELGASMNSGAVPTAVASSTASQNLDQLQVGDSDSSSSGDDLGIGAALEFASLATSSPRTTSGPLTSPGEPSFIGHSFDGSSSISSNWQTLQQPQAEIRQRFGDDAKNSSEGSNSGDVAAFLARDDASSVEETPANDGDVVMPNRERQLAARCDELKRENEALSAAQRSSERTNLARIRQLELALREEHNKVEATSSRCLALEEALHEANSRVDYLVAQASGNLQSGLNATADTVEIDSLDPNDEIVSKGEHCDTIEILQSMTSSSLPSSPGHASLGTSQSLPSTPLNVNRNLLYSPRYATQQKKTRDRQRPQQRIVENTARNCSALRSSSPRKAGESLSFRRPRASSSSSLASSRAGEAGTLVDPDSKNKPKRGPVQIVLKPSQSAAEMLRKMANGSSMPIPQGDALEKHSQRHRLLRRNYSGSDSEELEDLKSRLRVKPRLEILTSPHANSGKPKRGDTFSSESEDFALQNSRNQHSGQVAQPGPNRKSRGGVGRNNFMNNKKSSMKSPRLEALKQAWAAELDAEQRFRRAILTRSAKRWDEKLLALWGKTHTSYAERESALTRLRSMSPRTRKVYSAELAERVENAWPDSDNGSLAGNHTIFSQIEQAEKLYESEKNARDKLSSAEKQGFDAKEVQVLQKALVRISVERRKTNRLVRASISAWQKANHRTFFYRGFDYMRLLEMRYETDEKEAEERAVRKAVQRSSGW